MKLQYPFMQLPVSFDAAALAAEVGAIDESEWRPHPQGYPGNDALTLVTTGGDPDSDAVAGAMRATRHLERCPYLQQVLHSIGATWGRTRLMRLSGQAEVTPHVDVNYYWRERVRVHVPIVTQPTVRFTCGDAADQHARRRVLDLRHLAHAQRRQRSFAAADPPGGRHRRRHRLLAARRPRASAHARRRETGRRRSLRRTRTRSRRSISSPRTCRRS